MNRAKYQEHDKLIKELISQREKCKKSKRKDVHAKYDRLKALCLTKFDFLIDKRTRKYQSFANYDDLRQDGRVALMLAINSFDPNQGNFYWWANQYIKTKISREANRHSTIKLPMEVAKHTQPHKVGKLPVLVDGGPDAFSSVEGSQIKDVVNAAIAKLPDDQARIIRMRFEFNNSRSSSIKKMSKDLKISRDNCIQLLSEAIENLKNELQYCDFVEI